MTKPKTRKASRQKTIGSCVPCWLATGVAVGAVGLGTITGVMALDAKDTFDTEFEAATRSQAAQSSLSYSFIADVSWVGAGLLSAVTGYLFYAHLNVEPAVEAKE